MGQAQRTENDVLTENAELKARNQYLEEQVASLLTQFQELKRHVFGRKSEKLEVVSSGQTSFFELFDSGEAEEESPQENVETEVEGHTNAQEETAENLCQRTYPERESNTSQ